MTLRKKLEQAINSVSAENGSNTPDFILADYMMACLAAYDCATVRRDEWYGIKHVIGDYKRSDAASSASTQESK